MGLSIFLIVSAVICAIISGSVLLGGYMVNRRFNDRIEATTCQVYCSVHSYWCRHGAISQECFDVVRNVKPALASCWQAPTIGTFTNQAEADRYASTCVAYTFGCYYDPNNRCNYYYGYADVVGTLWSGVAFACLTAIISVIAIAYWVWIRRRTAYQQF